MFAISLGKFILFAVLVGVVWVGFRYKARVDEIRRAVRDELQRREAPRRAPPVQAEDLIKCTQCGAYVAARGAKSCGRADCPWPR